MSVEAHRDWGGVAGATLYTFTSGSGFLRAEVSNYGARLVKLEMRDADGAYHPVTLGWRGLEEWQADTNYMGTVVGRFGNRIKHGRFALNGAEYQLEINNGDNSLHGGVDAYDKQFWDAEVVASAGARGVKFTLVSPDMDHGYPGELHITSYILLDANDELLLRHEAVLAGPSAGPKTIVNLTNHTYWNLGKWVATGADVLGHELMLNADRVVETDDASIPTGRLPEVTGAYECFDFRTPRVLGRSVEAEVMRPARGYDHCMVFAPPKYAGARRHPAALAGGWAATTPHQGTLSCPATGFGFDLHTTEPGVQVYCANYLEPNTAGYDGAAMRHRGGLCLETQAFPDAPNHAHFPSAVLGAGERYEHTTVHKFFIRRSQKL